MPNPRISIVVPTLRRAETLRHCLRTVVAQTFPDCEFVVQNNGRDPAVEGVVREIDDPRLRHFHTDDVLPMTDNWNVAMGNASGEIVMFLGDDDGLFPDACAAAAAMFEDERLDLLSWQPYWYFWPGYFRDGYENKLLATVDFRPTAEEISSRIELARVYGFQASYAALPMIYNSFVHRRVIDRVQEELGSYFVGRAPDVTSGIVNAARSKSFVRLSQPLSITGTSKHSVGHNLAYGDAATQQRTRTTLVSSRAHGSLPDSDLLPVFLANDMLTMKEHLFPDDPALELNYAGLVQALAGLAAEYPAAAAEVREAISFIGRANGVDVSRVQIQAQATTSGPSPLAQLRSDGRLDLVIDGSNVKLESIDDAVKLMGQFVPRAALPIPVIELPESPLLQPEAPLLFSSGGNGRGALLEGWSEVEADGTWSVGSQSRLRFRIPRGEAAIALRVDCVPFVHRTHPSIDLVCSAGSWTRRWTFSADANNAEPVISIPPDAIDADNVATIVFQIEEPSSPAASGISSDTRLLGIRLRRIDMLGQSSKRRLGRLRMFTS